MIRDMNGLAQVRRDALRGFSRAKWPAATAIATLASGHRANTAIVSFVRALRLGAASVSRRGSLITLTIDDDGFVTAQYFDVKMWRQRSEQIPIGDERQT